MRYAGAIVASVALLVSRTESADACSCQSNGFDLPASETTGVPTNLRELYVATNYATQVRLRSGDGEELDLGAARTAPGYGYSMWIASVPAELRPNTHYTLWNDLPGSSEMLLAFVTGSGPDHVAPPPPRFDRFGIDYVVREGGTCGRQTYEIGGYVAAPRDVDIATVVVRFVRSNGASEERILPKWSTGTVNLDETVWFSGLGTGACQVKLELVENETYLVEAWTIDVAGNASEVTTQEVFVDGGCGATRPGSLGGGLAVLGLALLTRRFPRKRCRKSNVMVVPAA